MVTSLRDTIRKILDFRGALSRGENPNQVTAAQVGTYSKDEVIAKLAKLLGNGDLPLSQYGDLGFSAPNVSSRYEGATTTYSPIVYQVEQDGSRNYLRCGMDGQTAGVYLCKLFVDANGQMTGYSPMATPWRPAWLPAGDTITELLHGEPGKVAVRCRGTYNGKLPADSIYYAVTWANGTLNPDMYTEHRALTGLTQAGWDNRYVKTGSTLWLDMAGPGGFMARFTGYDLSQPTTLEVLNLTPLSAATLTPATEVLGFTGTDALGTFQGAANLPVTLTARGSANNGDPAYCQYDNNISGLGLFQTTPVLTILQRPGNSLTFALQHETWAGVATGGSDRKLTTRLLSINPIAKTFSVDVAYRGAVTASAVGNTVTLAGPCVKTWDTGQAALGNYMTGWSRCTRTGEILAQSTRYSIGYCTQRLIIGATFTDWMNPVQRVWGGYQAWGYQPNYPSPVGASIGYPTPITTGLRVQSTMGYCDIASPNYASPIPYTYPDGTTGQWAVDSGRTVTPAGWIPTRTMTVVPKSGPVRHVGMAVRGGNGNTTVLENGTRAGTWSVAAALDAKLVSDLQATMGANAAYEYNFSYYRPGAIGHLVNPLVVIGYGIDAQRRAYAYTAVYEITAESGGVVTALATAKVLAQAGPLSNPTYATRLCTEGDVTSPMVIAEASDYVCLCGASPWEQAYVGNAGQVTQALAMQSGNWKLMRAYQAHRYPSGDTMYYIPTKGPGIQRSVLDTEFAQTTVTIQFYGNTYATADVLSNDTLLVVTQAVYGSWNLYFAEEVRCQINGVTGKMPKKTVDLRTIKANPASTVFYLYATLTNGVFDYLITPTQQVASRTMIPIGTTTTNTTQIANVDVQKTFSIDGFSLSQDIVAYGIPMSAGAPYSTSTVINWPNVAT